MTVTDELNPCPFCGNPRPRMVYRTEHRTSILGLKSFMHTFVDGVERESEIDALDHRYAVYFMCPKCYARTRAARTEWRVVHEEEADQWADDVHDCDKFHECDPLCRPAIEKAIEAWNRRDGDGA